MTEKLTGECIGGPWAGQRFAHYEKTKVFLAPMGPAFPSGDPTMVVEVAEIGYYKHNGGDTWFWFDKR